MSKQLTPVALDVECYRNYFLIVFKSEDGRMMYIEQFNDVLAGDLTRRMVENILDRHTIITFNGASYDLAMVSAFLQGWDNSKLKDLSDTIILKGLAQWQLADHFRDLRMRRVSDHIDLVGVTPLKESLKTYGCRIHSDKLQDLPIEPDAIIAEPQAEQLRRYCVNDVDVTWRIYHEMKPQLELREAMTLTYGIDMRSKSDAQIAEAIIRHRLEQEGTPVIKRNTPVEPFKYRMPDFIRFKTETLQTVQRVVSDAVFTIKDTGNVILPKEVSRVIEFDGAKYKLGIGGLHSQEKAQVVVPTEDEIMGEYDVASMYPSIILGQRLYPEHLGEGFVEIYRKLFTERLAAKRSGDKTTADTLKIVLNSSYGKFGSKYSFLYSPELLIQTTLSGQLALLMLIERITYVGGKVVSANTDGVVVLMPRRLKPRVDAVCDQWTKQTTYLLEWTEYQALYSESVNSYVALKDGVAKTKGLYEAGSIHKGYSAQVCNNAVVAYLAEGTPIRETINRGGLKDFLVMRGVRGGAVWREQELGKVVRWYFSSDGEPIRYKKNGNKVAGSDGAKPMMDLADDLPADLDIERYVEIAEKKLRNLGL